MPVRLLNTDFVVRMTVISTAKETMGCQDATAQTFVALFSVQITLQTTLANLLQLQKNAMAPIRPLAALLWDAKCSMARVSLGHLNVLQQSWMALMSKMQSIARQLMAVSWFGGPMMVLHVLITTISGLATLCARAHTAMAYVSRRAVFKNLRQSYRNVVFNEDN